MKRMRVSLVTVTSPLGTLWQSHQVLPLSQKVRVRNFPNLSETLDREEESFLEGAIRGLEEELELYIPANRFVLVKEYTEVKPSPSTEEIKEYVFGHYSVNLSIEEALAAQMVVQENKDCVTYFEWRF